MLFLRRSLVLCVLSTQAEAIFRWSTSVRANLSSERTSSCHGTCMFNGSWNTVSPRRWIYRYGRMCISKDGLTRLAQRKSERSMKDRHIEYKLIQQKAHHFGGSSCLKLKEVSGRQLPRSRTNNSTTPIEATTRLLEHRLQRSVIITSPYTLLSLCHGSIQALAAVSQPPGQLRGTGSCSVCAKAD